MALLKQKWLSDLFTFKPSSGRVKTLVCTLRVDDFEDPELALAEPVYNWQQTEQGKFAMENSNPAPSYHHEHDYASLSHKFHIVAYFDEKTHIYWKLKYE